MEEGEHRREKETAAMADRQAGMAAMADHQAGTSHRGGESHREEEMTHQAGMAVGRKKEEERRHPGNRTDHHAMITREGDVEKETSAITITLMCVGFGGPIHAPRTKTACFCTTNRKIRVERKQRRHRHLKGGIRQEGTAHQEVEEDHLLQVAGEAERSQ